MIYPFAGDHFQKFYWGTHEKLIPVYSSTLKAMQKHKDVSTLLVSPNPQRGLTDLLQVEIIVNFASFRSVYESTFEILELLRKDRDTGANEVCLFAFPINGLLR